MRWLVSLRVLILVASFYSQLIVNAQPFECHPDCIKVGNCNQETGECNCPYGRRGRSCEIDDLSACRLTPEGPAHCGPVAIRSCKCLQQCRKFMCFKTKNDFEFCEGWVTGPDRPCFHRVNLGEQQTGVVPLSTESDVKFFAGYNMDKELNYSSAMNASTLNSNEEVFPAAMCPGECNGNGVCFRWKDNPNMQPTCRCYRGFQGESCNVEHNICLNKCGGRGKCMDSYCHCEPGYWGAGCSRSKAYPKDSGRPHPVDFKIYVYDLPFNMAHEVTLYAGWMEHDENYIAYRKWTDQLLASPVLTENPWEANLFAIPAMTYYFSGNTGSPQMHLERVINYVKETYPFWNRTEGRDHIVWSTSDRGGCYLEGNITSAPIKMVHFGYFDNKDGGKAQTVVGPVHPVWGCYHPFRDVVTPPFEFRAAKWARMYYRERSLPNATNPAPKRDKLFFFAGSFRKGEEEYSGGTRSRMAEWQPKWNDPLMEIVSGAAKNYEESLMSSKFCLAPYGHGYGMRIVAAMTTGCVPLIIQEHVFQPYEDTLPYEEFSLRLNNEDIPNLPKILQSVTDEEFARLTKGVAKYHKAFIWDTEYGGEAFQYSIIELKRRYLNFKSRYYGRHGTEKFL